MARKLNGRSISIHRSYYVKDIADGLGVHRSTILRWVRMGELAPNDDGKPILIHGETLLEFLERRKPKKQKCRLDEWFCMKCRGPRKAAYGEGEIMSANEKTCNIRALCCVCTSLMHKRFSISKLPALTASVRLDTEQRFKHLVE